MAKRLKIVGSKTMGSVAIRVWIRKYKSLFTFLLSCFLAVPLFGMLTKNSAPYFYDQVIIKPHGYNQLAQGDEIWIKDVCLGDKISGIDQHYVADGVWIENDSMFGWRSYDQIPDMTTSLVLKLPVGEARSIRFQTAIWRGIAEVSFNGQSQLIDCYSEEVGEVNCFIPDTEDIRVIYKSKAIEIFEFFVIALFLNLIFQGGVFFTLNKRSNLYASQFYKENILLFVILTITSIHFYLIFSERTISDRGIVVSYYYGRLLLGLFMLVLTGIFMRAIYSKSIHRERILYWVCVGFIVCSLFIRYPMDSWKAEPYWESSTNIIWQTYERSLSDALLLDDASYWTLFPRLIAILAIQLCSQIQYVAVFVQLITILFLAFVVGKLLKAELSAYGCIESRILICFLLGTTVTFTLYSEVVYLHNIAYVGGLLILLCVLSDMQKTSNAVYVLDCILCFCTCCSKPQILVFLPIFFAYAICFWKKCGKRKQVFLLLCSLGCIASIIYYALGLGESWRATGYEGNIFWTAISALYDMLQAFLFFFIPSGYYAGVVVNSIAVIILAIICFKVIACKNAKSILCILLAAFGTGVLMMPKLGYAYHYDFESVLGDFMRTTTLLSGRNTYLALMAALFIFILVVSEDFFLPKKQTQVVCMVLLSVMVLRFSFQQPYTREYASIPLNWEEFSVSLKNEAYGIPSGGPNDGFLLKNAKVYYFGNRDLWTYDGHFSSGVSKIFAANENISELSFDDEETVVSVYAEKRYLGGICHVAMNLYDKNEILLQSVVATDQYDRYYVGFIPDNPCENVSRVEFINQDTGEVYSYAPHVFTIVEAPGRGVCGTADWGINSLEDI